ncbi:PREDICTED: peptidyl-prolyl cis-trans isomerase D [Ceratosolen solmsi marchali]|uniref:peptidylprolyl isomerase n=1 Tax=Ceratosolen solmsi marchali TaxID=326594 RepID=A0AAJ6YW94_9HYME|nr:PREDICTED: peptidyl-prolyl cis-trans isomerase D [Ceratosolen solmsi marchali]
MKILTKNPIVFFDIAIANEKVGRVVIELFKDKVPRTAENFRALCTGEKGNGINGKPLHYKGSFFHRIVSQLMVQGGDIINFDGSSGESIYGLTFEDENLSIRHNAKGLLSMVNEGKPNSNSSQFVITIASCPQLNNTNVVFGKVIKGIGIINDLNEVPTNNDEPIEKICIINCGELTGCNNWGLEDNDGEDVYTPYPEDWNYSSKANDLTYENIMDIIKKIKNVGNACFLKKKYSTAEKKYKKALRYYNWMIKIKSNLKHNSDIEELKVVVLLNLAAVKLKQSKHRDTLNLCNQVLNIDKKNSKALFRRGQAHMRLNDYKLGLADLKSANEENPNNKDILKEIEKVKKIMKSYLIFEKAVCKRMFKTN